MSSETPEPAAKQATIVKPPEPAAEPQLSEPSTNGYADRNEFLALIGDLKEDTVEFETASGKKVKLLVRELTGSARADLITLQAKAYQKGELDMVTYERRMLLAGIADPTSPQGARQPLLQKGDADSLMELGASKVSTLVAKIEHLSGMGVAAQARVEGNSAATPNDGSTSG